MKFTIEIPDEEIKECIKETIVREITSENSFDYGSKFRKDCIEVIKELLYQPDIKQDIIERATDKAAFELRRKGMPVLIEKLAKES